MSSREGGSKDRPEVLGLYKMTETFHSGRPVWHKTAPPDRYLLYNGKLISFSLKHHSQTVTSSGQYSEWVISEEVSDTGGSVVKSRERGLTEVPQTGWQYYLAGWRDDPTLAVRPLDLLWSDEFEFLDESKGGRGPVYFPRK